MSKELRTIIIVSILLSFFVGGATGGVIGALTIPASEQYVLPQFSTFLRKAFGEDGRVKDEMRTERTELKVEEESATVGAVKKISPTVVSIIITKDLSKVQSQLGPESFPFDDFFEFGFPFETPAPQNGGRSGKQQIGGGTGFVISSDGLIVTNKHVVSDTEAEYTVITSDEKKYPAKVIASDSFLDIAIVKIDAKDLATAELGNSDSIQLGQTVIAIGNTLSEYRNTVTKGIISGINRRVVAGGARGRSEVIEEAIQTDAAINPGNSGGPLVNLLGQVIGINTAISEEGQLIGFAIPINTVKRIIESVKQTGRIVRPWLGVRYVMIDEDIAKENQLSVDYGAIIVRGERRTDLAVVPGSPADKAGLQENDIIFEINGARLSINHSLAQEIARHKPGDTITLKILRKGGEKTVNITLEELKFKAER